MAQRINTATTDETWWVLDKPGQTLKRMSSGIDGYPKTELMGKLHFMSFKSAKQALIDYIDREIEKANATIAGLKGRRKTAVSAKEKDFSAVAAQPTPPRLPSPGEENLGSGEVR